MVGANLVAKEIGSNYHKGNTNDTNKLKDIQDDNNLINKLKNGLTNLDAEGVKDTMQDVVDVANRDD